MCTYTSWVKDISHKENCSQDNMYVSMNIYLIDFVNLLGRWLMCVCLCEFEGFPGGLYLWEKEKQFRNHRVWGWWEEKVEFQKCYRRIWSEGGWMHEHKKINYYMDKI